MTAGHEVHPQFAAPALNGTVGGTMSILSGILNGGFFTNRAVPAGFGNLEALPPIDGAHSPFKRSAELPGTDDSVTEAPRERKQAERWECEWQPIGTGRPNPKAGAEGEPDMLNTLAKSKVTEYISEQLCTPINEEVEKHSDGYKKVVRIKKKTKQKYNKAYKKLMKEEEADEVESRGFPQKRQSSYKYRKTAWPKFENNPTFAARMKREEKAAATAAAEAATKKTAAAEKKAKAPKKPKAEKAAAKAEAAPPKAAKGKKAASA